MLSAAVFTLCLVAGLGYFAYQMYGRVGLLLAAKGMPTFDRLPERLRNVGLFFFGQKKFVRPEVAIVKERTAGWMHFFIFWAFTVLGAQVLTMFARAYVPEFYLPGLGPSLLGKPYSLLRDCLETIVVVCIAVALTRWLVTHPPRLFGYLPAEQRQRSHAHWEAYLILCFIATIGTSGLVYDAGRIVAHGTPPTEAMWEPVSYTLSRLLGPSAVPLGNVAWWVHNLVILTFLNFLPTAKHFHVITSLPNVFWKKLEPVGALSKMDLENGTTFGTSRIDQFTWKQVLDMFSCTECGRCSSQCPATATGKPLAPRQLMLDLRNYLYAHQAEVLEKRLHWKPNGEAEAPEVGENVVGSVIEDEVLWSCNTCRACEESCPVMIEYVDKVVDMRRHLVQEEARFPQELTRVFKGMETQSNPWGIGAEKRFDWAEGMDIPLASEKPGAEYLYYVGCAGAFDDRNRKTTQAFARLLKKAGVDFACLGPEEPCNGDSARRLGNEYLYQAMAQMCVETFNGYQVKKIIVNCPHCFNTIKNELPQFEGHYEVVHAAELVQQLIRAGRIDVDPSFGKRTVYHDSCYYGRFNDVYDEPRDVLEKAGANVVEMQRHRHFGMCCGAGGGRMWIEEDPDKRVNLLRTDQALASNPEAIAVSCPFCMTMLSDGIKAKDLEEKVQTLDVIEIVERATR
ncbi:MAG: (Fe-S)-binding protein [Candidatus Binatia bacterium]